MCLLAMSITMPAAADFRIQGGGGGYNLAPVTSDVPDPGSFLITGSSPADDTDVQFHLHGTYADAWHNWTNDMYFRADASTGEIGTALLSHTNASGPSRTGPYSYIDVTMRDTFHVDPGGGFGEGDPVEINFLADWTGHILLQGLPSGGSYVHYRARLQFGGVILAELNSVNNSNYPPMDLIVNRLLNETISVNVGDVLTVRQYISFDLNGSEYSGVIPSGDNNLDFLNTGWAGLGYAPGYEGLNIWSDAGAVIVPEPGSLALIGVGLLALLRRTK